MSGRTIAVIGLAIFCGLAAALGIFLLPRSGVVQTRPVVFAVVDVKRGDVIKEPMLELRQIPVDQSTPGSLDKLADVLDRVDQIPMFKDEPISDAKLFPKGNAGDVAARTPPGMRAYSIPMTIPGAESLSAGNRVDVLYKVNGPQNSAGGVTKPMMLQNIEVLDTTPANKLGPNTPGSVTLVVTLDQATILGGQNPGDLHVILRNDKDNVVVEQKREVAFAKENVPIELPITQAMIEIKELPLDKAGLGVDPADLIGRSPRDPILKGQMILETQLLPKGFGPGLAAKIKRGMRAHTISTVAAPSRVGGFLRPGSQVDVLWTPMKKGADAKVGNAEKSVVLAQNVEILAVDTTVDPVPAFKLEAGEERSVTLLVTPEQALLLDQGESTGTLHLSLRHALDVAHVETRPVVFAVVDVPDGESITQDSVMTKFVPLDEFPSDGFQNIPDAIGRIARGPIKKGESITESRLFLQGSTSDLASKILPGKRAYTILTPTPTARLAGFLCPGNKVDVLWTKEGEDSSTPLAPALVQNSVILAVDRTIDPVPIGHTGKDEEQSVTLMVTPEEAAILDRSQRNTKGILHLALRNPNDKVVLLEAAEGADSRPLTIRTLRGTSAGKTRINQRVLPPLPSPQEIPNPPNPAG